MIHFQCSKCGKRLAAKDESAGKRAKCPGCGQLAIISVKPQTPHAAPRSAESQHASVPSAQTGESKGFAPITISFVKKATITLADNERVSLWDDMGGGTISLRGSTVSLQGTWRVSAIGNFLGSGILGFVLIRPFFQKRRMENIPIEHVERVVVGKKWTGKTVYQLFQSRDAGMAEVHTFALGNASDAPAIEQLLKSIVSQDRFQRES